MRRRRASDVCHASCFCSATPASLGSCDVCRGRLRTYRLAEGGEIDSVDVGDAIGLEPGDADESILFACAPSFSSSNAVPGAASLNTQGASGILDHTGKFLISSGRSAIASLHASFARCCPSPILPPPPRFHSNPSATILSRTSSLVAVNSSFSEVVPGRELNASKIKSDLATAIGSVHRPAWTSV